MEKIGLKAVFETEDFKKGIKDYENGLTRVAEDTVRAGEDFRDLDRNIDDYIDTLKAATPENARYAQATSAITNAFEKGEISAEDAKRELEKLRTEMGRDENAAKGLQLSFTEVNQALQIMDRILGYAKQGYEAIIDPTMEYAAQVRDLSRLTGMSADESSRMIQVADDMTVSYEDLSRALQAGVRKGVDPSIQSIADLSDEYLALAPGLERSKFLMDNFGRSSQNVAQFMELGGDKIMQMSANMEDGLILTQSNIDAERKYEIALDDASDAIMAMKIKLGNHLIPMLTEAINKVNDHADATDNQSRSLIDLKNRLTPTTNSIIEMADANKQLSQAAKDAGYYIKDGALWMHDAASGARILIDANYILTQGYIDMYNSINNYNTGLQTAITYTDLAYTSNEDYIRILAGIPSAQEAAAIAAEEASQAEIIAANNAEQAQREMATAIGLITAAFGELTTQMLFQQAAVGLDQAATLLLARGLGLLNEDTYAALTAVNDLKIGYDANGDGALTAAEGASIFANKVVQSQIILKDLTNDVFNAAISMTGFGEESITTADTLGILGVGIVTVIPGVQTMTETLALESEAAGDAATQIWASKYATDALYSKFVEVNIDFNATGDVWAAGFGVGGNTWGVGGSGGANQGLPGTATGGEVSAGRPTVVGEYRPEVFVPATNGYIYPSSDSFEGGIANAVASALRGVMAQMSTNNYNLSVNTTQSLGSIRQDVELMRLLA